MNTSRAQYDIVIVGGGASGTALLYALAAYTDVARIALVEKYDKPGQVNSKATNNSQTLHVGDIETNYSVEKVRHVKSAAMMVKHYADTLPDAERDAVITPTQKMVLGVGAREAELLAKRHADLRQLFPELQLLEGNDIARLEPMVMQGRDDSQPVAALYNQNGYAVNFQALAESFVSHAVSRRPDIDLYYGNAVQSIRRRHGKYELLLGNGTTIESRVVVVDADSYSLLMAKRLGYGLEYSLIPIAGTFYFSEPLLKGKVYTVQDPKLPFAAVHGDPDIAAQGKTRWGPTARFHPVLESRNFRTSVDYLKSSGLNRLSTWYSFFRILLEPTRFLYLVENMLYELPWIGDRMFLRHVRKIIPSITSKDIVKAEGFGGMRLQRVDTTTHELQLGEGKIVGEDIIFNMTPSPGASVSLYNAMRDIEQAMDFFGGTFHFEKQRMCQELTAPDDSLDKKDAVSLSTTYVS